MSKSGEFDLDGLCEEMRRKARCTERGVMLTKGDIHDAVPTNPLSRNNHDSGPIRSTDDCPFATK
jgi:hypothetical protein